jgi:hypothetical protein
MLGVQQGLPAEQENHFILQGFEPRIVQAIAYSHPVQLPLLRGPPFVCVVILYFYMNTLRMAAHSGRNTLQ